MYHEQSEFRQSVTSKKKLIKIKELKWTHGFSFNEKFSQNIFNKNVQQKHVNVKYLEYNCLQKII